MFKGVLYIIWGGIMRLFKAHFVKCQLAVQNNLYWVFNIFAKIFLKAFSCIFVDMFISVNMHTKHFFILYVQRNGIWSYFFPSFYTMFAKIFCNVVKPFFAYLPTKVVYSCVNMSTKSCISTLF